MMQAAFAEANYERRRSKLSMDCFKGRQMPKLDVYVAEHCWSCHETRKIVADLRVQFPDVAISLLDIDPQTWPDEVFAVPTYLLNGRVISLGNPTREMLYDRLIAANPIGATHAVSR